MNDTWARCLLDAVPSSTYSFTSILALRWKEFYNHKSNVAFVKAKKLKKSIANWLQLQVWIKLIVTLDESAKSCNLLPTQRSVHSPEKLFLQNTLNRLHGYFVQVNIPPLSSAFTMATVIIQSILVVKSKLVLTPNCLQLLGSHG